jgi:transcriptional regulator with XRE-family HTH domain
MTQEKRKKTMQTNSPLAQYLKKCREKAGYSQTQVSAKLGYTSPQFISNWERGLSHPPVKSLNKLAKLYKVKGVELGEIFIKTYVKEVEEDLRRQIKQVV